MKMVPGLFCSRPTRPARLDPQAGALFDLVDAATTAGNRIRCLRLGLAAGLPRKENKPGTFFFSEAWNS
jgi:hypothetical protein